MLQNVADVAIPAGIVQFALLIILLPFLLNYRCYHKKFSTSPNITKPQPTCNHLSPTLIRILQAKPQPAKLFSSLTRVDEELRQKAADVDAEQAKAQRKDTQDSVESGLLVKASRRNHLGFHTNAWHTSPGSFDCEY